MSAVSRPVLFCVRSRVHNMLVWIWSVDKQTSHVAPVCTSVYLLVLISHQNRTSFVLGRKGVPLYCCMYTLQQQQQQQPACAAVQRFHRSYMRHLCVFRPVYSTPKMRSNALSRHTVSTVPVYIWQPARRCSSLSHTVIVWGI